MRRVEGKVFRDLKGQRITPTFQGNFMGRGVKKERGRVSWALDEGILFYWLMPILECEMKKPI